MAKEDIFELDETNYQYVLTCLKAYIGENYAGKPLEDSLRPIHDFFLSQSPGGTVKDGIITALLKLEPDDFCEFIPIQEHLIASYLDALLTNNPTISCFALFAWFPDKTLSILRQFFSLYQYFDKHAADIIAFLSNLSCNIVGYGANDTQKQMEGSFFLIRLQNYCNSLPMTLQKISSIGYSSVMPTTGDLHNGGKNPLIFSYRQKKYVYKPRDMTVDLLVAQSLSDFQALLPAEFRCPISFPLQWQDNLWVCAFETNTGNLTESDAHDYFRKFGALLCFAKIFGIHDLHEENIMATSAGPVIIDAECAFYRSAIISPHIEATTAQRIFQVFSSNKENNAVFKVSGQPVKLSLFKNSFLDGFRTACLAAYKNQEKLKKIYGKILKSLFLARWVPIGTSDLYSSMYAYITPGDRPSVINDLLNTIAEKITDAFHLSITDEIRTLIIRRLDSDFCHGDIPVFYLLHYKNGACTLQMDETSILHFPTDPFATMDEFTANIQQLYHTSISDTALEGIVGHYFN